MNEKLRKLKQKAPDIIKKGFDHVEIKDPEAQEIIEGIEFHIAESERRHKIWADMLNW